MSRQSPAQPSVDVVDRILSGRYISEDQVQRAVDAVPELRREVIDWLVHFRKVGDWRRFERYAVVAAYLHPDGLGALVSAVLDTEPGGVNLEDLVDVLGQIRYACGVQSIMGVVRRSLQSDAPYYTICRKCISSLGEIGTEEAQQELLSLLEHSWPDPLRWYAAVELGMDGELGFDEEQMLRFP